MGAALKREATAPSWVSELDGYSEDQIRQIIAIGKRQLAILDAGRQLGPYAMQEAARARRQFMIDTAITKKAAQPYLLDSQLIALVDQAMREQRSRFTFGNGRFPSPSTIRSALRAAGIIGNT